MESKKSISYYKAQAKDQLLGNYGVAIGSFVLIFACYYAINGILTGAYTNSLVRGQTADPLVGMALYSDTKLTIASLIISLVARIFYDILFVGFYYILVQIVKGNRPKASDVFYAFSNHPDKVIIISLIIELIKVITMVPAIAVGLYIPADESSVGPFFLAFIIAFVLGCALQIAITVSFTFSFLVYLDEPEYSALECLKRSADIIKGYKLKYIYMILSLVGFYLLGILSVGIGLLYVISYQSMIVVSMYMDLKAKER